MAGNKLLLHGNKIQLEGNKLRLGSAGDPCCCAGGGSECGCEFDENTCVYVWWKWQNLKYVAGTSCTTPSFSALGFGGIIAGTGTYSGDFGGVCNFTMPSGCSWQCSATGSCDPSSATSGSSTSFSIYFDGTNWVPSFNVSMQGTATGDCTGGNLELLGACGSGGSNAIYREWLRVIVAPDCTGFPSISCSGAPPSDPGNPLP